MTTPDTCPECDRKLQPAFEVPGTGETYPPYCTVCERTWPDEAAGGGGHVPEMVEIVIPWNCLPSDNLRTRRRGDPQAAKYRRQKQAMETHMMAQVGGSGPLIPKHDVSVELDFFPPDAIRRDMANLLKAIQDSMEDIIITDDYQIVREAWERHLPDGDDPRCEIAVFRIGGS